MLNFTDALNTPTAEIERPPLMPMGTYRFTVAKVPTMDTIADGRFDVVDFQLKVLEPQEDVDQDELAAYGSIANKTLQHRFMFNKEDEGNFNRTLFQLKQFLYEHLQVDVPQTAPLKEALNGAINCQCLANVKWQADKNNPEVQYERVGKTAPVE